MDYHVTVEFKELPHGHGLPLPQPGTSLSAGLDLAAALEKDVCLAPGERALIPCGFSMALPKGFEAQIRPRSGMCYKFGVTVLNAPGTIDADYRGEVKVLLINLGQETFTITRGMRIAQLVVARFEAVTWQVTERLSEAGESDARGLEGFGSTGFYVSGEHRSCASV